MYPLRKCVLFGLFIVLGCQNELTPFASLSYQISSYQNATAHRNFDQCVLRYAFRNDAKTINIRTSQKSLEVPFDQWQQANGYIEFVQVGANAAADINFVFSDSLTAGNTYTDSGLVRQSVASLSQLAKQADGTYTIYLLDTYRWDISTLQRVLLFQIGSALGLATSTNPASAMSNRMTTTAITLDSTDVRAVQQLYDQPCDQWTRLPDLPFDGRDVETSVATSSRGFVLMNAGNGKNAFWEFIPASNSWRARTPYPVTQADQYGFSPGRLAFVIDSLVFVGNGYNDEWKEEKSGAFWQYKPSIGQSVDQWIAIANQPQLGYSTGRSFSVNGKGYLVSMNLNSSGVERIAVCEYNPIQNAWSKPSVLGRKSDGFYSLRETFPFVLNQQAYLISPNATIKSWLFDPNQLNPWTEIATFNGTSTTKTGFAVRDAGYGISGEPNLPKGVWQYKPERGWKKMQNFLGEGKLAFSFVVNNRAYVGTSTGQFWTYRP
ncbi:matrixin family metalloprotease [Spirosoma validum]|uniref:Matrixin family metalloprotease n=1 Tax=Spirosoma validum TaxID=2771355 RepID=A0A927GBM2_9BACT|nr:matrixin family metalloprotease [Spirosoma validum]MBD2751852.1 matrixin family metalloprotease [Spirosoma validum]